MPYHNAFHRTSSPRTNARGEASIYRGRVLLGLLAVLGFGLLFTGAPHRAGADLWPGAHVYLYTLNGPVDVTSTYFQSSGQDYVDNGSPIPVTFGYEDGHVYDLAGNPIGYLALPPPP